MINRELYLPRSWTTEPDRCERVGVPSDAECLTKPALPAGMPSRALRASVAAQWVAADEVYSADSALRTEMEAQ